MNPHVLRNVGPCGARLVLCPATAVEHAVLVNEMSSLLTTDPAPQEPSPQLTLIDEIAGDGAVAGEANADAMVEAHFIVKDPPAGAS